MPHRNDPEYSESEEGQEEDSESRKLSKAALKAAKRKPWWENSMWTWAFQGCLAACMALMVGYVTLWIDNHNDNRYLKKPDYDRDQATFLERYKDNRESDRKDRDTIRVSALQDKAELNKRLDRQEIQLDTIANDIKSLLRKTP